MKFNAKVRVPSRVSRIPINILVDVGLAELVSGFLNIFVALNMNDSEEVGCIFRMVSP